MNNIDEVFASNEFLLILFDYFSQIKDSMVYVVMEMGDTDLSRLLRSMSQEKQISLTMILYYWTEMLTAVKHIHDNGKNNMPNYTYIIMFRLVIKYIFVFRGHTFRFKTRKFFIGTRPTQINRFWYCLQYKCGHDIRCKK